MSAGDNIPGLPEEASNPDEYIPLEEGLPFYGPVLDGTYAATLPVACGTITQVE